MANINIRDLQQVDSELNNFEPQELTSIEIALINGGDGGKGRRNVDRTATICMFQVGFFVCVRL